MDIRKIQLTGKSTYVISLPKSWINDNNIQKQDELGIITQNNGTLLITKNTIKEIKSSTKRIRLDKTPDYEKLLRTMFASYISGFTKIIIQSEFVMGVEMRKIVDEFTGSLIGAEIIEATDKSYVISGFKIHQDVKSKDAITLMGYTVRSMLKDFIQGLHTNDQSILENIHKRDAKVNKINHFFSRLMVQFMQNHGVMENSNLTMPIVNCYFIISLYLETIGDNITNLADLSVLILNSDNKADSIDKVEQTSKMILEIIEKSVDAWINFDYALADEAIDLNDRLREKTKELQQGLTDFEKINHIDCMLDNIQYAGKIATNIAFVTLDAITFQEGNVDERNLNE
ncbi:MAG: phosphate uptake regulator PhoU [Promethearchaeota archaeon]|nr:MAG: phosphate uptake regulator PhoU [Candidatus Lokiarchaeota archaeon]